MTYHVHAVEQDLAGKWYARVCITESEAVFLKFQEYPSMNEIQEAAELYVANLENSDSVQQLERARNELGQFVGDDPTTADINEAWTYGTAE